MRILPRSTWSSLYSMVTFSNEGYSSALRRERAQARLVKTVGLLGTTVALGAAVGSVCSWVGCPGEDVNGEKSEGWARWIFLVLSRPFFAPSVVS